jgi:hypothetical protein
MNIIEISLLKKLTAHSYSLPFLNRLADHSLVDELKRVHEDIREFYYEWAFLQETELFQAFTKSLFALSTRDFEDIVDVLTIEVIIK